MQLFATVALASTALAATGKYFDNYIFVIMENTDVVNVLKSPEYSHLISEGVEFTSYFGVVHPSQPNYWATIAQDTYRSLRVPNKTDNDAADVGQLIDGDNGDDVFDITGTHIGDRFEDAGVSWGIYSENYPGNATSCFTGEGFGTETGPAGSEKIGKKNRLYKRKHNPFMSFTNINTNVSRCGSHVFSYEEDWAAAVKADKFPDYMYIVPNQVDDAHDFVADTDNNNQTQVDMGVEYSAQWLLKFLGDVNKSAYLNSRRTLIHITFDEDNTAYTLNDNKDASCKDLNTDCPGDKTNNQVYGVLLGTAVSCYANTTIDGHFDHFSIVATLNDNWGLPSLGNAASYSAGWPLKSCPVPAGYKAPGQSQLYSSASKTAAAAAVAAAAALLL